MEKRKTPMMGWPSWNCFRANISEEKLKVQAYALVEPGIAECGYTCFNTMMAFFTLHEMATDMIKDRNTKIILYCSKGKRSAQAYNNLSYLGYKSLYCLGGIDCD